MIIPSDDCEKNKSAAGLFLPDRAALRLVFIRFSHHVLSAFLNHSIGTDCYD